MPSLNDYGLQSKWQLGLQEALICMVAEFEVQASISLSVFDKCLESMYSIFPSTFTNIYNAD